MGATNFLEFSEGFNVREAFDKRYEELERAYGEDPYNGTMSTTELLHEVYYLFDEWDWNLEDKVWDFARDHDWGEKWYAQGIDCGEISGSGGKHMFAFYGLASC